MYVAAGRGESIGMILSVILGKFTGAVTTITTEMAIGGRVIAEIQMSITIPRMTGDRDLGD